MKIVIALGGNSLEEKKDSTFGEQFEVVNKTVKYIVDIISLGHQVILVHGNGPQVGRILLQSYSAREKTPEIPLDIADAMTEGFIGYQIQQRLSVELEKRLIKKDVLTLITQVLVDKNDQAFKNPTKPIGVFYTEEEAKKIQKEENILLKEDSGRGWRRVVPSPIPQEIKEINVIKKLYNDDYILICCGGGGIPVSYTGDKDLIGQSCVIDKDFASEKLAEEINADLLLILTNIEKVAINYNTPNQKFLDKITLEEVDKYIDEKQFGEGSMLPKVQSCAKFVKKGKKAIITSIEKATLALEGKTGTLFLNK